MREQSDAMQALGRAGRRAGYHLIQALIESLKAVEAVFHQEPVHVSRLLQERAGGAVFSALEPRRCACSSAVKCALS